MWKLVWNLIIPQTKVSLNKLTYLNKRKPTKLNKIPKLSLRNKKMRRKNKMTI